MMWIIVTTKLLQSIEGLQIMNTDHLYVTDYSQVMMKADVQAESKKAESMLVWAHECFKKKCYYRVIFMNSI